jgi:hypothetical protein
VALSGHGFTEGDNRFDWEVVGFGTEDRWYDRSPTEDTMASHAGEVEWRMLIHAEDESGNEKWFYIDGGFEDEAALSDAIDEAVEEGDYF